MNIISRGRYYSGVINGDIEEGILMAGQISGLIRGYQTGESIIEDIVAQAEK